MKKIKKKKSGLHKKQFTGTNAVKMLALVLMLTVLGEGVMFGLISAGDINNGLEVLDMSSAVMQTKADLEWIAEPYIAMAANVDQFYELAATHTMFLLEDNIVTNIGSLFNDINRFYWSASEEMTAALDLSSQLYPQQVYASY